VLNEWKRCVVPGCTKRVPPEKTLCVVHWLIWRDKGEEGKRLRALLDAKKEVRLCDAKS